MSLTQEVTRTVGIYKESLDGLVVVEEVVEATPRVENTWEINGNCQTWVFDVVQELVNRKIIGNIEKLDTLKDLMNELATRYICMQTRI